MRTANSSLWEDCMLEGEALDRRVHEVLGLTALLLPSPAYSVNWAAGGPLIEQNQIFLDPPTTTHLNYGPGPDGVTRGEWVKTTYWTATVSASVRTKPDPRGFARDGFVGRGMGSTPLIAAMRAIVSSFPNVGAPKDGG